MPPPDSDFSQGHYAAIGRMLVTFQSLEATVTYGLMGLLELGLEEESATQRLARATINELSFGSRLRLMNLLPSLYPQSLVAPSGHPHQNVKAMEHKEASDLVAKGVQLATDVEQRRNRLVHSHWLHGPNLITPPGTMLRMKIRAKKGKLEVEMMAETVEAIEAVTLGAERAQQLLAEAASYFQFLAAGVAGFKANEAGHLGSE